MAIFCYIFLLAGACIKSLHYVIIKYLLKQKQEEGEDIGMFGESYLEMIEVESNTKEVHVSFVEKKKID